MALISDIKKFKKYLGGPQRNMDWSTWQPFCEQADARFIEPVLGSDLYQVLCDEVSDPRLTVLKQKVEMAAANYAYMMAIPQLQLSVGDAGISTPQPDKGYTPPLMRWQVGDMVTSTMVNGDDAMERALVYLESIADEKLEDDTYLLKKWRSSNEFFLHKKAWLNGATMMTIYLPMVRKSRRFYVAMYDYMMQSQSEFLIQFFDVETWKTINDKMVIVNADFSKEELEVLRLGRYIIAYHAMHSCLPYLNITDDFRLLATSDGVNKKDLLSDNKATQIKLECENNINKYSEKLVKYLSEVASETVFKSYFKSELYKPKHQHHAGYGRRHTGLTEDRNYIALYK